jgi:cellulose biosynthesis protein BcsQ
LTIPVITFFNNKGGVGKTSLVYHLAWMLSEMGHRVIACDLDPQSNLTAAFLDEEQLEALWNGDIVDLGSTIFRCIEPLTKVGDIRRPALQKITSTLALIPGDLALSGFEDELSTYWPRALGGSELYRPFRLLTAFWTVMQWAAQDFAATHIVADVGPNLGAINRSALIATDYVVVPLGADLFSLQGLRNLGPTLKGWRAEWRKRRDNWPNPEFPLPSGAMRPIGYVVQQYGVRLSRPVAAYDKWVNRMPEAYQRNLLDAQSASYPLTPASDPNCLATLKHFRSLIPMAQEARKPIFKLTTADGAIGSHANAVGQARTDFAALAVSILQRVAGTAA